MSLLGTAALAMWWDVTPAVRAEFEDWHAHEHFQERLGIPGFRRATRWTSAAGGEGFFVMYELDNYEVLSSPGYAQRLNAPSPWSARMMPHHRHMVRSQCHVLASHGAFTARHALTIRLSPTDGRSQLLQHALGELGSAVRMRPGVVGLHLLRHQTPPLARTTEQQIRGNSDRVADWVLVATGYDAGALLALGETEMSEASLMAIGAASGTERHLYGLAYSATPADVG